MTDDPISVTDLNKYRSNIHSQHGEDGILAAILSDLQISTGYFCEFGAWDGKHLSNTYALYEKGWLGCYIEGDSTRHGDLTRNITRDGMALINAFVMPEGENSLDAILTRSMPADRALDLLSIDIDSDDLAIWRSVKEYRPKVVVIEYNPTIPFDVRYENPRGENKGNAPLSIYEYGSSIGYDLVAVTTTNLIFVDQPLNERKFKVLSLLPKNVTDVRGFRMFFGYDGTLIRVPAGSETPDVSEVYTTPWNGAFFSQPVPRRFRHFSQSSPAQFSNMFMSAVSVAARRPVTGIPEMISLWRRRNRK